MVCTEIAFSTDGNSLFITNWAPAGLSRTDMKTGKMEAVTLPLEKPLVGPADMTVVNHRIYIPDLPNSRVISVNE